MRNLTDLQADLIFIKNIDNIAHEHARGAGHTWIRCLGGLLVRLQRELHGCLIALESSTDAESVQRAEDFLHDNFPWCSGGSEHRSTADRRVELIELLNRPLRVCGMVQNVGEPGGGPFWVRESAGAPRPQIAETTKTT